MKKILGIFVRIAATGLHLITKKKILNPALVNSATNVYQNETMEIAVLNSSR